MRDPIDPKSDGKDEGADVGEWLNERGEPSHPPQCEVSGCGRRAYSRHPMVDGNGATRMPALCRQCADRALSFHGGALHVANHQQQIRLALNALASAESVAILESASEHTLLALTAASLLLRSCVGMTSLDGSRVEQVVSLLHGRDGTIDHARAMFEFAARYRTKAASARKKRSNGLEPSDQERRDLVWNDKALWRLLRGTLAGILPNDTSDEAIEHVVALFQQQPLRRGRPKKGSRSATAGERYDALMLLLGRESTGDDPGASPKARLRRRRRAAR